MNLKINILTKKGFTNLDSFFFVFSMIYFRKAQILFLMAVDEEATELFYELKWR